MLFKSRTRNLQIICCAAAIVTWQFSITPAMGAPRSSNDPEDFRFEITGAGWIVNSSGTIQASGTPVNLVSDLGAHQRATTFYGKLVFKPARKHRIVLEGTPFSISGNNTIQRAITYQGQTFNVNENVRSTADLNYVFAGYQYDVISNSFGHLGFSVGGAYLGATGSLTSTPPLVTASKTQNIGLPLAGAEVRIFPIPGHRLLTIEGDVRGMAFGDYGNYLEASGSGGLSFGPVTLLAGYRSVRANIHSDSDTNSSGVDVRLKGPIFSAQWRW